MSLRAGLPDLAGAVQPAQPRRGVGRGQALVRDRELLPRRVVRAVRQLGSGGRRTGACGLRAAAAMRGSGGGGADALRAAQPGADRRRARRRRRQLADAGDLGGDAGAAGRPRRHCETRDIVRFSSANVESRSRALLALLALQDRLRLERHRLRRHLDVREIERLRRVADRRFAGSRSSSESGSVCRRLRDVRRTARRAVRGGHCASATAASACTVAAGGSGRGDLSASRYLPITRARRHRCEVGVGVLGREEAARSGACGTRAARP